MTSVVFLLLLAFASLCGCFRPFRGAFTPSVSQWFGKSSNSFLPSMTEKALVESLRAAFFDESSLEGVLEQESINYASEGSYVSASPWLELQPFVTKRPPYKHDGYVHNETSRAKISAANKGRIPWNMGRSHSDEARSNIRAGVQKFVQRSAEQKAAGMNMTFEQYLDFRRDKRREINRRAQQNRRNSTYSTAMPNETRQRISQKITQLWRSGFYGSTKDREAVKEEAKRQRQLKRQENAASHKRIKEMKAVRTTRQPRPDEWKQRMSALIKAKWEDPGYRERVLIGSDMRRSRDKQKPAQSARKAPMTEEQIEEKRRRKLVRMHIEASQLLPVEPLQQASIVEERAITTPTPAQIVLSTEAPAVFSATVATPTSAETGNDRISESVSDRIGDDLNKKLSLKRPEQVPRPPQKHRKKFLSDVKLIAELSKLTQPRK